MGGSGAEHLWILDRTRFRAFGSFGQPNPFGGFLAMGLLVALGLVWGLLQKLWESWRVKDARSLAALMTLQKHLAARLAAYLIIAGLLGAGLLASWSRGAWIGAAGAFGVMVVFAPRRRAAGIGIAMIGIVGLFLIWQMGLLPASIEERVAGFADDLINVYDVRGADVTDENYAVIERLAHWQAAAAMADDHPWLGVGPGNYAVAYPAYALLNWPDPLGHAHNFYLNTLAETGIIGLAAYLGAWAALMLLSVRALHVTKDPFTRGAALGILGALCHFLIHSLVDNLMVNNIFLHLGVLLGVLAVISKYYKKIL
jgi:O-antigen ligase